MFQSFNPEVIKLYREINQTTKFRFKEKIKQFFKARVQPFIRAIANLKSAHDGLCDEEAITMLEKALLGNLLHNHKEVNTCLLCLRSTNMLVRCHSIPMAVLKLLFKHNGSDAEKKPTMYSHTGHSLDIKSVDLIGKMYSMICRECAGPIMTKDEHQFFESFFKIVYQNSDSLLQRHLIPYTNFLYRFALGLLFLNASPLYSMLLDEIEDSTQITTIIKLCRQEYISASQNESNCVIYLIFLPSQLPTTLPQVSGWSLFLKEISAPFAAYKLVYPGNPLLPHQLYCFMVKIGILVFLISFDEELDAQLKEICPQYEIQISNMQNGHEFCVPEDKEREKYIPQKLWWSFLSWAEKFKSAHTSSLFLTKLPEVGIKSDSFDEEKYGLSAFEAIMLLLEPQMDSVNHTTVEFLASGFELNLENNKHSTIHPVKLPEGHEVLLHENLNLTHYTEIHIYHFLCRIKAKHVMNNDTSTDYYQQLKGEPYLLVFMEYCEYNLIIKLGYQLDINSLDSKDAFPGVPNNAQHSQLSEQIALLVPNQVRNLLLKKGFRSLISLVHWQETMCYISSVDQK